MPITVSELIVELKRRHGITDTEIAATLGVCERTLHRWATASAGQPSPKKARVLMAMLDHGGVIKQQLDALFEHLLKAADAEQSKNAR